MLLREAGGGKGKGEEQGGEGEGGRGRERGLTEAQVEAPVRSPGEGETL